MLYLLWNPEPDTSSYSSATEEIQYLGGQVSPVGLRRYCKDIIILQQTFNLTEDTERDRIIRNVEETQQKNYRNDTTSCSFGEIIGVIA